VAAAQNTFRLLNVLEVRKLVAADTPAAHAALAKHFVILATNYRGDAQRYSALASVAGGNPNHPVANLPERWMSRATAATSAANTVRAVAAYHQLLSMGMKAQRPAGAAEFDGGKGAPAPTASELNRVAMAARTRADREELAEYYRTVAGKETARANDCALRAQMARVGETRTSILVASQYERMMTAARDAAKGAALAARTTRQPLDEQRR
jgi:hypothetical protein